MLGQRKSLVHDGDGFEAWEEEDRILILKEHVCVFVSLLFVHAQRLWIDCWGTFFNSNRFSS